MVNILFRRTDKETNRRADAGTKKIYNLIYFCSYLFIQPTMEGYLVKKADNWLAPKQWVSLRF
jgi:hypothetical protein